MYVYTVLVLVIDGIVLGRFSVIVLFYGSWIILQEINLSCLIFFLTDAVKELQKQSELLDEIAEIENTLKDKISGKDEIKLDFEKEVRQDCKVTK